MASLALTFGSGAMTNSIMDSKNTDLFLMIGSNPDTGHPTIGMRIHQAVDKGAKLIVVDPRRTRLAERADHWLRIKPGTDVAFLNGLMHIILEETLWDKYFVEERTEDFNYLKEVVTKYNPEYVSGITGLPIKQLYTVARMYAAAGRHAIYHGMGITHYVTGTDRVKSIANLAMLCGKVGVAGGGCNPLRGQNNVQGACDMGALFNTLPGYTSFEDINLFDRYEEEWKVKLPRIPGKPATEVWDNVLSGEIKGLYIFGEDPAIADPNIAHVHKALDVVDFMIVQDIFLTETAKAADVVFPAACYAEKDGTFTNTERRVQRVRKAVDPPGEARPDWKIFCDLSDKMGYDMHYESPKDIFEEIRKMLPQYRGITYERLEKMGLQWPVPDVDHPGTPVLHTKEFTRGKGLFIPEEYIPPVEKVDEEYPLYFTTGRDLARYNFSSMTGKTPEIDAISPEAKVEINPLDAKRYKIKEGDMVRLASRRGKVEMKATLTDRSQEGTLFATYNHTEALVNFLTLDALDRLSRTPEYKLCAIKIQKIT
ncbi:putative anaerobic dehydrogenase [Desulfocapsa sulfexigens DSM 10523]|uniref:Putative anaerobic dehydrogenase n=1 Tax=Desulfocapsa sulfexigens (strain DSM 10523 / SB164P1) TaxID=1167006 RepID=M1PP61_DESSD|nr:putative anaerobic dehydrogenase [Desulfocapsa sulfexigens DSM 10523]